MSLWVALRHPTNVDRERARPRALKEKAKPVGEKEQKPLFIRNRFACHSYLSNNVSTTT